MAEPLRHVHLGPLIELDEGMFLNSASLHIRFMRMDRRQDPHQQLFVLRSGSVILDQADRDEVAELA